MYLKKLKYILIFSMSYWLRYSYVYIGLLRRSRLIEYILNSGMDFRRVSHKCLSDHVRVSYYSYYMVIYFTFYCVMFKNFYNIYYLQI